MGKKEGKKSKKEYNIDKIYKLFNIFLFEIQILIKKFIKKFKNILVVSEKAVTLHPQSREVACELSEQMFEKKK